MEVKNLIFGINIVAASSLSSQIVLYFDYSPKLHDPLPIFGERRRRNSF